VTETGREGPTGDGTDAPRGVHTAQQRSALDSFQGGALAVQGDLKNPERGTEHRGCGKQCTVARHGSDNGKGQRAGRCGKPQHHRTAEPGDGRADHEGR
jgi:hypothetical protein